MQSRCIPCVDFCKLSADTLIEEIDDHTLVEVSEPIVEAFQTTGFLFLLNSGVTKEEVTDFNNVTGAFFRESFYNKQKFSRKKLGGNHGWVALEVISFHLYRVLFLFCAFSVHSYCSRFLLSETTNCSNVPE